MALLIAGSVAATLLVGGGLYGYFSSGVPTAPPLKIETVKAGPSLNDIKNQIENFPRDGLKKALPVNKPKEPSLVDILATVQLKPTEKVVRQPEPSEFEKALRARVPLAE